MRTKARRWRGGISWLGGFPGANDKRTACTPLPCFFGNLASLHRQQQCLLANKWGKPFFWLPPSLWTFVRSASWGSVGGPFESRASLLIFAFIFHVACEATGRTSRATTNNCTLLLLTYAAKVFPFSRRETHRKENY